MSNYRLLSGFMALVFAFALFQTGCAARNGNERAQSFQRDGYLGLTNVNPNLQTSPNHHTYAQDQKLMDQVVKRFPQIRHATFIGNGPFVHVTVLTNKPLAGSQKQDLHDKLVKALRFQIPRYQFKVNIR